MFVRFHVWYLRHHPLEFLAATSGGTFPDIFTGIQRRDFFRDSRRDKLIQRNSIAFREHLRSPGERFRKMDVEHAHGVPNLVKNVAGVTASIPGAEDP